MPSENSSLEQPAETTDSAEARMRLALGLGTRPSPGAHGPAPAGGGVPASHDPSRQRRRFAQDGDVPVVMLHRNRDADATGENKLATLTADLREERAARLKSERALEEANLLVQSLRTKLKHTEMTYEERLRDEQAARAQAEALLVAEREARSMANIQAAETALAVSVLERAPPPQSPAPDLFDDNLAETPARTPKRRGPAKTKWVAEPTVPLATNAEANADTAADTGAETDEKPIEWWLPSFRASRKAPVRKKRVTG
jgi:hypothetical protein